jgi:hypothetical protein
MTEYNMTYSNMINSIIVQVFLVACIALFLLIRSEPRMSFVPTMLMNVLQQQTGKKPDAHTTA